MKRSISVLLSVILMFALLAALSGCGAQKKLVGTWEASVDMTDMINQMIAQDEDMAKHMKISKLAFFLQFTFNDDGTYRSTIDEKALNTAVETLKKDLKAGCAGYFEEIIADLGVEMTVDQFLASSGYSLDEIVDGIIGDEMVESWKKELNQAGKYEVKDGKLFLSEGKNAEIDKDVYLTYELSGDELKIVSSSNGDDGMEDLLPLVFQKID